jgi:hypothetical protein
MVLDAASPTGNNTADQSYRPYRGEFSVSTDAYQYILDHVMNKTAG